MSLVVSDLDWQESKTGWTSSIRRDDVAKLINLVKTEAETKMPEGRRGDKMRGKITKTDRALRAQRVLTKEECPEVIGAG